MLLRDVFRVVPLDDLFDLYGRGLALAIGDLERFIAKTEGASPAFIKELLRKAALFAAEADSVADECAVVKDERVEAALRELVLHGGLLTRELLGFTAEPGSGTTPAPPTATPPAT